MPTVKIRMIVTLLTRIERTLLVSFDIRAEQKAAGNRLSDIQSAFAVAFGKVQKKLAYQLRQPPK